MKCVGHYNDYLTDLCHIQFANILKETDYCRVFTVVYILSAKITKI